ncbi:MAG: type IV secretory system conjugative DNA transfer family protein [Planctomycetales bacterium]|nr:type IV secretory system conjugative DNA transfer family protein [Planctomycetales bacterium]
MWPFSSGARRRIGAWDLSTPILRFSDRDPWTIGDSCMGTQIFGGTGSGKSTGSLAAICRAFLRAGYGGLFLTAKPEDTATYQRYCAEAGRLDDLSIFGVGRPLRYNALDAELRRRDAGAGLTENVVALLTTLLEVSERNSGDGDREDSGYWKRVNRQLLRNTVDLLVMAKNRLSVPELYKLVVSAPTSRQQVGSDDWRRGSFCYECLKEADAKDGSRRQRDDLELVSTFFLSEWANLSERTRSVVLSTFTSMLDVLNRGVVRELLSGTTNVTPEEAQDGRIILIDLPLKVFGELGVFVQVLWKFCFQRAMERRDVGVNPRPVFLVADESHLLTVSTDQVFQTTARSTRTAVVYATQSISNYLAALGGDRAEPQTHSLLGNLQTQIFHQQADIRTNEYAAQLIGRTRQFLSNANTNYQPDYGMGGLFGSSLGGMSAGVSEVFEFEVQPSVFTTLAKGGPPEWNVGSIVFQGGRRFHDTGRSWLPVTFRQQV